MKIQKTEAKKHLIERLRKIEGQIHGVQNMIQDERDCREIVQQLSAIRSAVQGASRAFLQEYAAICLLEMTSSDEESIEIDVFNKREKIIHDMIDLLDKAP